MVTNLPLDCSRFTILPLKPTKLIGLKRLLGSSSCLIAICLSLSGLEIAHRSNGLVLAFEKGPRQHTVHEEQALQSLFHSFLHQEDVRKFKRPVLDLESRVSERRELVA